jgi:hypothetical protein
VPAGKGPEEGGCVRTHAWWVLLFLVLSSSCARDGAQPAGTVEPPTLSLSWVRPRNGQALADSVWIEVLPRDGAPDEIRIAADDSTVAILREPPWTAAWLPQGRARRIGITARAGAVEAPSIGIDWSPNQAPRVEIRLPRGARGIDLGSPDSIRCEAIDPEDGVLPRSSILWTSNRQGFLGGGVAIPIGCLVAGPHRIRARATDRWLRASTADVQIEAFTYSDRSAPDAIMEDVRHAWLAADIEGYAGTIDPAFRYVFCPIDVERDRSMPVSWDFEAETRSFSTLTARPGSIDRFDWRIGSLQESTIGGRRLAKAEIEAIEIRIVSASAETLSVRGGRARVYLIRDPRSGAWRIEEWIDRGAEGATSQGALRMSAKGSGG